MQAGVVSTGNSLDCVESDMKIMLSYNTAVKEMEANAIAWVVRCCLCRPCTGVAGAACAPAGALQADMFKVPLLAVKAVTDIVDGDRPTGEEFLENLHKTVESLTVRWQPTQRLAPVGTDDAGHTASFGAAHSGPAHSVRDGSALCCRHRSGRCWTSFQARPSPSSDMPSGSPGRADVALISKHGAQDLG